MAKDFRFLRLNVKFYAPGVSPEVVKRTLIRSIQNGSYDYPRDWLVGIYWSNQKYGPMKSGEFGKEMQDSRDASAGFDEAVIAYLRRM